MYEKLLKQANYPINKSNFLLDGFRQGFDIGYSGPRERVSESDNIPFKPGVGDEVEMWNKMIKEVSLGRYAGPYEKVPYDFYIQSPIGLVPKDQGKKTRLIFHLSYDFSLEGEESVNHFTPDELCSVKYKDLDFAVSLSLQMKENLDSQEVFQGLYYGKTDLSSAFRILPLSPGCYCLLIMKAKDPESGSWWYFIDKCLPFGSSRSCALFQEFSDSLQFLTEFLSKRKKSVSNFLDDFLFIAAQLSMCNHILQTFLDLCETINCPVSEEKTVWGTQLIVFLGILLDGKIFLLMLPADKCSKAKKMLQWLIEKKSATVKELQRLTGTLNFLTKAIFAGRTFTRCMYAKCACDKTKNGFKLKHYHHVKLDKEFKDDCRIWVKFLESAETNRQTLCRPFIDMYKLDSAKTRQFYSDAAKRQDWGYGAFFDGQWLLGRWEDNFIAEKDPSIEYLEPFALCAGIFTWSSQLMNCRIVIYCDNQAVMNMVNNLSSSYKNCMILLRLLVLNGLYNNRRIYVRFVKSKDNFLAYALSRGRLDLFKKLAPANTKTQPDKISPVLWPLKALD